MSFFLFFFRARLELETDEDKRGADYGGVTSRENCANLPDDLQGGCYWRYNWAGGEVNGWDIIYTPVSCPARLTEISGCAA